LAWDGGAREVMDQRWHFISTMYMDTNIVLDSVTLGDKLMWRDTDGSVW
jgi:hypothetical protein